MHDRLTDVIDDIVELQSTQQKRADHAATILQTQGQLRAKPARGQELQFMQKITQPLPDSPGQQTHGNGLQSAPDSTKPASPQTVLTGHAATSMHQWSDRVRALPEMRSALVALSAAEDGITWSSPFSLPKADLEPWLSYLAGYKKSSLFASPARSVDAQAGGLPIAPQLQPEVQALLKLRKVDPRLILEPPVQISGPVEYLDLIAELKACRDPRHAQELAKVANEIHDNLLAQALEKGREMGEHLYHALLGPDFTNLAKEWQKIHQRKPSIDELCYMLTTGNIKIIPAKPRPAAGTVQRQEKPVLRDRPNPVAPPPRPAPAASVTPVAPSVSRQATTAAAKPQQYNAESTSRKVALVARQIAAETAKHNRFRKVLRHLCQISVCCAALAAHALAS